MTTALSMPSLMNLASKIDSFFFWALAFVCSARLCGVFTEFQFFPFFFAEMRACT